MNIQKIWILLGIVVIVGIGIGYAFSLNNESKKLTLPVPPKACTAEAKICPDGSAVGRTGPNCEFAACPTSTATSTKLTTYLGGQVTGLNITINPREIVSDSRCPEGVQCIWAGTVEVKTVLSSQVGHGEHVLKLGEPQVFGDFSVTLTEVTPTPKEGKKIPPNSYRFVFEVKKR